MTLGEDKKLQWFGTILAGCAIIKKLVKKWLLGRSSTGITRYKHELRDENIGDYRRNLRIDPATFDVLCLLLQP